MLLLVHEHDVFVRTESGMQHAPMYRNSSSKTQRTDDRHSWYSANYNVNAA